MPRIGKNGNIINVYKLRTMHPYSEYIQDHILQKYGYNDSGKPANDFRLSTWGKFLRKKNLQKKRSKMEIKRLMIK